MFHQHDKTHKHQYIRNLILLGAKTGKLVQLHYNSSENCVLMSTGTYGSWRIPFLAKYLCKKAFCRALGIGEWTFKQAKRLISPVPHGNIGKSYKKQSTIEIMEFLNRIFALAGDPQPNTDEIHLPMCIDK